MASETVELKFSMGVVSMDWRGASIVPCTKGRMTRVNLVTREVFVC